MRSRLRTLLLGFARVLLRLRYRVQIEGSQDLALLEGPTLVLPNHPAYIDPVIVLTSVKLPGGPPRPVVYTDTYRMPPIYPLMKIVDAVEVPDLHRSRRAAADETRQLIDSIVKRVCAGDSFLVYPSGRLQRENLERVGTARMTHDILSRCSDVNVVLVRTRGVWGSVFSCAPTGNVPDLSKVVLVGVPRLLGSLVLFLPRRQVSLSVKCVAASYLSGMDRTELNVWLESWYNSDGGEAPNYVPYRLSLTRRPGMASSVSSDQEQEATRLRRRRRRAVPKDVTADTAVADTAVADTGSKPRVVPPGNPSDHH